MREKLVNTDPNQNCERCEWCKDDDDLIHRDALCKRCYLLKQKLISAEAKFQSQPHIEQNEQNYLIAKRKIELLRWEGNQYGDIDEKSIDGARLEYEWRFLSKRLIGKDLFSHCTNFDGFTQEQRRTILKCIAKIMRRYLQNRRHLIAVRSAYEKDNWEEYI
jgi:hypothetical protein